MSRPLSTAQIRETYLQFFEQKGHLRLPGHSTVSPDDTTMFTVAGMQQFKPQFMGEAPRFEGGESRRVTTAQRCVRVDDIENVGRTRRHLSLFEMMGNFSFGDYFKRDAIHWAWEFLTGPEWMGFDPEKVYVTVYQGDDEAFAIWTEEVGVPAERIHRFGADENFWPADAPLKGPNGPCGPCSEIYYDRGPEFGSDTWADYAMTRESARFLEVWNLVFPQYDRQGLDEHGQPILAELPFKNIDTGMGLERVASVVQGVPDFYSNDVFAPIVARVAELSGQPYEGEGSVSHRVVAEHIRSVTMILADGVRLSNTGRGYVIRKVLRRASRHAYLLGLREPVLHSLVPLVVEAMQGGYPELAREQERVTREVRGEEERFLRTLAAGTERLTEKLATILLTNEIVEHSKLYELSQDELTFAQAYSPGDPFVGYMTPGYDNLSGRLKGTIEALGGFDKYGELLDDVDTTLNRYIREKYQVGLSRIGQGIPDRKPLKGMSLPEPSLSLDGNIAFTLYDTYGFPLDLTQEIAAEHGVTVDVPGYEAALAQAQDTARAGSKYGKSELFAGGDEALRGLPASTFVGYEAREAQGEIVAALPQELGYAVVLSHTPFYAEGGGQVGDTGRLTWDGGAARVVGTRRVGGVTVHEVEPLEGEIREGLSVRAVVADERAATERHHTATHLLHAALRAVLGEGARQAGSLVTPERLRFDYTHGAALTTGELGAVEALVSRWVSANFPVRWQEMPIAEARAAGAMALFGEKYGDTVRVVSVEGAVQHAGGAVSSLELCGGTHTRRTGDIGAFVVVSDEAVAAGVRRVEALAGEAATRWLRARLERGAHTAALLNTAPEGVPERVLSLQAALKAAEKEAAGLRRSLAEAQMGGGGGGAAQTRELGGFAVAAVQLSGVAGGELRGAADRLLDSSGADLVVVASDGGLVVKASKDAVARGAHAGQLVGKLAAAGGGKGGGRPDMAQAGIKDAAAALAALDGAFA